MNPQFCCPFVMRPKLVPVVVRPTVPVDYRTFDPPSPTYNIPLFPIHLTANAAPTTRKTRWELEKLVSPTDGRTKELFFKLAAQKNGIRIGKEQNKGDKNYYMCLVHRYLVKSLLSATSKKWPQNVFQITIFFSHFNYGCNLVIVNLVVSPQF